MNLLSFFRGELGISSCESSGNEDFRLVIEAVLLIDTTYPLLILFYLVGPLHLRSQAS